MGVFSSVLTSSLQGIAERPLPCKYNVIQFLCALSRRVHEGFDKRFWNCFIALIVAIRASGFNYLQIVVSFTAVTRVQIPSGTPNLFSNLRLPLLLYIGTKKAQFSASTRMHFIEAPVFSHRSRHFEQAQIRNTSQQTGLNQQPLWTPGEDE